MLIYEYAYLAIAFSGSRTGEKYIWLHKSCLLGGIGWEESNMATQPLPCWVPWWGKIDVAT